MVNNSGSYSLGGKSYRGLAAQVEENTKDIKYLFDNGVLPEGTLDITENGEYNVKRYADVDVQVPIGVFPTGTKIITTNGSFNIRNYENVLVNVSGGVEPTGTLDITENGEYNITYYEKVNVQVPIPAPSFNNTTNISITINNTSNEQKTFNGITYLSYIPDGNKIDYVKSPDVVIEPGTTVLNYEIGTGNENEKYVFYVNTSALILSNYSNCIITYGYMNSSLLLIIDPSQTVSLTVTLN